MIKVSAFRWVPPFARGLVRDLRVRWALEEVGLPYEARLIGPEDQKSAGYRAMQPFGQVPAYEEDDLVLFESGAILLHIAGKSDVLMPTDAKARARTTAWMFAALNSIEPLYQQPDRDRPVPRRSRLGEAAPAGRAATGGRPAQAVERLARRPRLSGRSLHRRRPADDNGAAHSAPLRFDRALSGARGLSPALRGAAGVQARARCADGGFRREAGGGLMSACPGCGATRSVSGVVRR